MSGMLSMRKISVTGACRGYEGLLRRISEELWRHAGGFKDPATSCE